MQQALFESGCTLIQRWHADVPWGTEVWRATQLLALYEIMDRPGDIDRDDSIPLAAKARWGVDAEVGAEDRSQVLPRLVAAGRRFGIVYVDGSHLYENVFVDCYHAVRLLGPGGVLVMDDAPHPHVARVVRFLRRSWRQCLEPLDLWPYRAAGAGARGRLRYRLAEALGKTQIVAFRRTAAVLRDERAAGGPV